MSMILDILSCFCCCCCDDPHFDNDYHEISTANSSTTCRFSNVSDTRTCVPGNNYQTNQPVTSTVTPLLYYDHYPNYYKEKESDSLLRPPSPKIFEPSSKAFHNAKTSSPLLPPEKPQSSPVLSKPSSQPVAPFTGRSTLSSHLSSSSSIHASSSSSSSSSGSNSLLSTPPSRLQTTSKLPSPSPLSSVLTQSLGNQLVSSYKLPTATPKPSKTASLPSPSTSFPEPPPASNPTLRPASSSKTNAEDYILDANSSLPIYLIPKDVEDLIKNDIVPQVLRKPLSPLTYKFYFAALLHAEDFYCKKWSKYKLENVSLELQQITIHKRTNKKTKFNGPEKVNKTFVAFEIDSVPERRPFLLSRDLVHAKLSGRKVEPFQGFVYRISKSNSALGKKNILLVDFGEDFYSRHRETNRYDISFTFNRVCLKRAHQAIEEASDSLFQNFLFPESRSRKVHPCIQVTHSSHQQLDPDQKNAIRHISLLHGSPPCLIKGPPCVLIYGWRENRTFEISRTGAVVKGAVFQIYSTSPNCRILICAPTNTTCDELMISLKKVIPESNMFRATAAFRELDEVPDDILSLCDYDKDKECFTCPSLDELHKYKIIFSTFMSSFRLHAKGLAAGHFSHIFLLDASAAIEPETLVPLTKFATDATTVIVTGQTGNQPYWVRSTIARRHGLKTSYFERLEERLPYRNDNPLFISEASDEDKESNNSFVRINWRS